MGNLRKDNLVRHHLLEIILWPNEDGTFTEIRKKISEASKGKAGTNTGKKFSENWKNNMKSTWATISKAYKEHKLLGGTLSWIEFLKSHKNSEV